MDPDLIELLACPDCHANLSQVGSSLKCSGCQAVYEVANGIPILLPRNFDTAHLQEEESLSQMMKQKEAMASMAFNLSQWKRSKLEFWSMVRSQITGTSRRIVNIGCGYDLSFSGFDTDGHVFVNFDMVLDMLRSLRSQAGARCCVNGDLNSLPFKREAFDYVVSIDVIHHECERLGDLLASFRDLLKPGGMLFLEDPNAWGMFQMAKSVFLPRPVYRSLRSTYHSLRRSQHRPADYEFPTDAWKVKHILKDLGFEHIRLYPHSAYPTISRLSYGLYRALSWSPYVRTYHNYHYMLSAAWRT
jgi:uncharacterized protein